MRVKTDARMVCGARVVCTWFRLSLGACAMAGCASLAPSPALSQTIVASINGDPVTNIDIEERMKMLRVLRKPATRDAAIESLFADRLEMGEARKFGIEPRDSDISQQIVKAAQDMKVTPEALVASLQHAGVTPDHFKAHFAADLAFSVLIQALNKGVEASEEQVRAELAKQGGKAAAGTQYTIRQVILAIPHAAGAAALQERAREAEQLRERFTNCQDGVPLARSMTDVTVRDPLIKTAVELGDAVRQLLDNTPAGHLTPPQRSFEGIEMIAVCNKGAAKDDSAARAAIAQKLLAAHIAAESERKLKELRARAVVVKY